MEDYLKFRKMITPLLIQVLFWVVTILIVIMALYQIFTGVTARLGGGQLVLRGLITLVLGPVLVRIYCELLILLFKMNDTLTEILTTLKRRK